jgi:L-fucose isomerase-like protein
MAEIIPPLSVGLLTLGRKRPGFDPDWGRLIADTAWQTVQSLGVDAHRHSAVVNDDPSLRAALHELRSAGAQALVVLQPTMGDGRLSPLIAQLWARPIVLWATPERPDGPKVSACSLVASHVFASNLRQLGFGFELVYGHPDDANLRSDLLRALRLVAAASILPSRKLGLVGYHAPGFIDMHADPASIMRHLGVATHHFGLQEFIDLCESLPPADVDADLQQVLALNLPRDPGIADADLLPNSRYALALRRLIADQNLDALALRCWPELPNRFGHWPYLAMSRLTDDQHVVALEGDADGALLGLLAKFLGLGPGYLTDWLEHTDHTITLWHPGHAPRSLCDPDSLRLSRHFNDAKPLVLDADLLPDSPITLARLWRCDNRCWLTAFDARTINPADRRHWHGCTGLACLDQSVPDLFDRLIHVGMPHHLTLLPGHHTDTLRRLARLLRIDWLPTES